MNTPEPEPDTRNTRPQGLVLGLLGQFVLDRAEEPVIPTQAFLAVLGALGVSEAATRATLNRMAHRDLLTRHKQGRSTAFGLTPDARTLAGQGRDRIFAATPFDHPEGNWTVLSCPLPESLRNARYQLQTRLSWAGFGPLRGNLWIAPGHIDVEAMLAEVLPAEELDSLEAFYATPAAPSRTEHLILKAWDLDALRAAHDTFLNRWEDASPPPEEALPQLVLLLDDWSHLLRTDPGLPAAHLGPDWPAHRSTAAFQRLHPLLLPLANDRYDDLLCRT